MPPKPKCSREDIINAAYELMNESGVDAIVAREVGKKIGTTTGPIFTFFSGMNELKEEVYQKAFDECLNYLNESLAYEMAYREFGHRWIKYAYENPHAYRMLFVTHRPGTEVKGYINEDFDEILLSMRKEVKKTYELSDQDAKNLIDNMCIYAQGIATLLVNGLEYDSEKIDKQLSRMCTSYVVSCKLADGSLDVEKFKNR